MLKITKGLKKKKKGKKGKHKEEELFEEAELEQYRKEQEEKRRQQAEVGEAQGSEEKTAEKGEEWEKFKALTSGVDSILKKTQGDLDRIKSTSYFQRKPTPSELAEKEQETGQAEKKPAQGKSKKKDKKWIGFEDGTVDLADQENQEEEEQDIPVTIVTEAEKTEEEEGEEFKVQEEDDEEFQSEDEDDIFDTSFVDAVASGEVKLAYIPDSPQEEVDEFDPFDTSIVDSVIKETPADKKRRELVSLGCAVEVLTGKVDKPTSFPADIKQKRSPRRVKPRDLLLGSFDKGQEYEDNREEEIPIESEVPVKTLLDDDPLLGEDIQLDLSVNLAPIAAAVSPLPVAEETKSSTVSQIPSFLSEFDSISNKEEIQTEKLANGLEDDDLEDEFAVLAAESLTKEVICVSPLNVQEDNQITDVEPLKPVRPPPPKQKFNEGDSDQDNSVVNCEDDPFDTTFAAEVLPGKYELKLIEEEILKVEIPAKPVPTFNIQLPNSVSSIRDPLAFDEHNLLDEYSAQTALSFKHRDLLGGSTTDLSKISHDPIEPAPVNDKIDQVLSYCDPFDTSIVNDLVAPGKAELKFLEEELLAELPSANTATVVSTENEDDDFDPRADSPPRRKSIPRPEQLFLGEKRQSIPKVVAFKVATPEPLPDLLSVGNNENGKSTKPLTPYYPEPKLLENKLSTESEQDPFDTSFVSSAPGKLELKLIESELVGDTPKQVQQPNKVVTNYVNDPDFDPRASESIAEPKIKEVVQVIEPLPEVQNPDFLSEDVEEDTKLHTPVLPKRIEESVLDYTDPFDTSIAQHILPGKAELKLLESELIDSNQVGSIKRSYTDPDFNPRTEVVTEAPVPEKQPPQDLYLTEHPISDEIAEKPLTPLSASAAAFNNQIEEEEIDPFDTSCVGSLIPGKVELKLLESELIHN